ncbi:uncharacterized protein MICPUCDRAFT_52520 [Micromonas pusilla CCMP1545]|uniref:Predicted protein n=1 Tax=Micromonas pusilla (strain CCMP1545) TaxID=564608 RepID=C1N4D9_MICPC|nr:uncharacterized protein MICPUCDRAFT_52520 [Micromonas pusilla CCMP1545]EEH52711.1 predicted protein [Micromonas pusilla CCMP1545]|eukprot:XP_003062772.1 predicted protein [Micromonas pusilla CCMP1545]
MPSDLATASGSAVIQVRVADYEKLLADMLGDAEDRVSAAEERADDAERVANAKIAEAEAWKHEVALLHERLARLERAEATEGAASSESYDAWRAQQEGGDRGADADEARRLREEVARRDVEIEALDAASRARTEELRSEKDALRAVADEHRARVVTLEGYIAECAATVPESVAFWSLRPPEETPAAAAEGGGGGAQGAFYLTLVPIRPRRRGERRSLRTFAGVSLRPPLAFNNRPRRLSTPFLTPFNSTPTFATSARGTGAGAVDARGDDDHPGRRSPRRSPRGLVRAAEHAASEAHAE